MLSDLSGWWKHRRHLPTFRISKYSVSSRQFRPLIRQLNTFIRLFGVFSLKTVACFIILGPLLTLSKERHAMFDFLKKCTLFVQLIMVTSCGLWSHSKSDDSTHPFRVVVIGAGPAGLVSALEANQAGATVSVIEKRAQYTRKQHIILDEPSLNTLKRLDIDCPELSLFQPAKVGIVPINKLEEALKKKAILQGISILAGTMKKINSNNTVTIKRKDQHLTELGYDVLIGADGGNSNVRSELGISMRSFGEAAWGAGSVLKLSDPKGFSLDTFHIEDPYSQSPCSLRRFVSPDGYSVVFSHSHKNLNREEFSHVIESVGFKEEAELIRAEKELGYYDNVSIKLVQARQFLSSSASALIIGDAAASASFFEGKGANTAIATAVISGEYIRNRFAGNSDADEIFHKKMEARTLEMIQASQYLFDR